MDSKTIGADDAVSVAPQGQGAEEQGGGGIRGGWEVGNNAEGRSSIGEKHRIKNESKDKRKKQGMSLKARRSRGKRR